MSDDPVQEPAAPRRGRPRMRRRTECGPFRCYAPQCEIWDDTARILLLPEEIETLRLVDLEGLEQEEAASVLGISRKTLWKDLHEARRKVTDALVNGKVIELSGCRRRGEGACPRLDASFCPKQNDGICSRCRIDSPES